MHDRARGAPANGSLIASLAAQGRAVLMDATNGVNKHKYALTTLMVITRSGFGIPVAWIVHSSNSAETVKRALDALGAKMGADFLPSVMIIDDAAAEIAAVQESVWCARGRPRQCEARSYMNAQAGACVLCMRMRRSRASCAHAKVMHATVAHICCVPAARGAAHRADEPLRRA